MIDKIKDFISDIKWEWDRMSKSGKITLAVINGIFLLLFFFIGIPGGKGILTYVIGFIVLELFFIVLAFFVKTKLINAVR